MASKADMTEAEAKCDEVKRLKRLVEDMVNSGRAQLDEDAMKKVKKICKSEPDAIPLVRDLLLSHLRRNHSQVRVSALQACDQLFVRSHHFRTLLVEDLREVAGLVVEAEAASEGGGASLPPPKAAREQLKRLGPETIRAWSDKFGEGYPKLRLAFNYFKQVRRVDFEDREARSEAQRRRDEERQRKTDNIWRERVKKTEAEMKESESDFRECLVQIDACLEIIGQEEEDGGDDGDGDGDDDAVVDNLRDQHHVLTVRLIPTAKKWSATLARAGSDRGAGADLLKRAIDARQVLEEAREKVEAVGIDLDKKKRKKEESSSDDDDDDFVEVELKEDYEEFAKEPDAAFAFAFVEAKRADIGTASASAGPRPSTSKASFSQPLPSSSSSSSWRLGRHDEEADDPTTFSATVKKLKADKDLDLGLRRTKSAGSASSSSSVPTLPYDVDLYNWGEKPKPRKVLVDSEKLRFWGSGSVAGTEDGEMEVPGTADSARSIEFSGKFLPVAWTCRAPMPSGRLCPRRDREKCPLHGKVIPRDANTGNPSNLEDRVKLEEERERKQAENPDWQDPALLRELKAATGVDLRVPKKGERRRKKGERRHPGLISLKEEADTARKRLEKKVFNRSSAKRVAATLNRLDATRHKDKFADQFNYVFSR